MSNPILIRELNHQWYVMEKSRSGRMWILLAVLMLLPALLTSLVMFVGAMFFNLSIPPIPLINGQSPSLLAVGQALLLVMSIALYVVVMLVSFGLATNSITREKRGKTWDNLILTNISARQLVIGKWWASLQALNGDHVVVGLLRLGLVAWVVVGFRDRMLAPEPLSIPVALILFALLVVIFTLIDAMFNTALGIAVMMLDSTSAIGASIFLAVRSAVVMYGVWLFVSIVRRLYDSSGTVFFWHGMLGMILLGLMLMLTLWVAQWIAVRNSLVSEDRKPQMQ